MTDGSDECRLCHSTVTIPYGYEWKESGDVCWDCAAKIAHTVDAWIEKYSVSHLPQDADKVMEVRKVLFAIREAKVPDATR
jgi:hypothetical protein